MKGIICVLTICLTLKAASFSNSDYVPNSETAIKIAEAIWLPIYGQAIYKKTPFKSSLVGDSVWFVTGSLPKSGYTINESGDTVFIAVRGGVPCALINKKSGCVIRVYHTK
jgi:hypothetical protein